MDKEKMLKVLESLFAYRAKHADYVPSLKVITNVAMNGIGMILNEIKTNDKISINEVSEMLDMLFKTIDVTSNSILFIEDSENKLGYLIRELKGGEDD